jgi:tRNA (adenine37-N6)-methyltransferase
MINITYKPIGIIHTHYNKKETTPIQGFYSKDSIGEVEIFPEYVEGLRNIENFSHIFLIYHFHLAGECSLLAKPFLDDNEKGIFAIRHYNRPNNIGLSLVRLIEVISNRLKIGEVDMLDGTPLLDIKPFVSDFDNRYNIKEGWYKNASNRIRYEKNNGINK